MNLVYSLLVEHADEEGRAKIDAVARGETAGTTVAVEAELESMQAEMQARYEAKQRGELDAPETPAQPDTSGLMLVVGEPTAPVPEQAPPPMRDLAAEATISRILANRRDG